MYLAAAIIEQLEVNGELRSFRMQAAQGRHITVAFANEYDEDHSGPFHFLDGQDEVAFQKGFAECRARKVAAACFGADSGRFHFRTSWAGIPTERGHLSYYTLSLPAFAIPTLVKFSDPRSGREFRKTVVRDDPRQRFVLYLECRSSHQSFDFTLGVEFEVSPENFSRWEYCDQTTAAYGAHLDAYEHTFSPDQRVVIQNFLGDQYNVFGQAGAVGPHAVAEENVFAQESFAPPKANTPGR